MWTVRITFCLGLLILNTHAATPSTEDDSPSDNSYKQPWFVFDKADEILPAKLLENPLSYDAGIAYSKEGLWLTWLEFCPGQRRSALGRIARKRWLDQKEATHHERF